jgi:Spy/CpxP family protein refolding chaperone
MADPVDGRSPQTAETSTWLVLFYQLPAKHSPARLKAWRRLHRIGAVTLKNSAYVLPNTPEAREDFEWIKTEIIAIGGQAMVLASEALDSATRQQIIDLFRTVRAQDFDALRQEARAMLDRLGARAPDGSARRRLVQSVRRLRERFRETEAIDFFDAPQRTDAARIIDELDERLKKGQRMAKRQTPSPAALDVSRYRGRVWITRSRPGVDRMSSAWLILRFIDPNATFAFGDASTQPETIPFDMFGAEFGHHGTSCTFETIAQRFGIADPAVAWLGRIVHDLDLKEETFSAPEKAAVGRMIEGLRRMYPDDRRLLEEGITMFEALYRSYAEGESSSPRASRSRSKPRRTRRK